MDKNNITILMETYKLNNDQYNLLINKNPNKGPYRNTKDIFGNNLWFYWGNDNSPIEKYKKWKNKLEKVEINELNNNNENLVLKLVINDKLDIIYFLLKLNFNLNFNIITIKNENIIHYAVWSNNKEIVEFFLLKKQYDINLRNEEGISPLIIAIHNSNIEIIYMLLLFGSDPNIVDCKGKNALHHAAEQDNIDIYNLIEEAGGNPEISDILKRTPIDILEKNKNKKMVEKLHIENYWKNKYLERKNLWK